MPRYPPQRIPSSCTPEYSINEGVATAADLSCLATASSMLYTNLIKTKYPKKKVSKQVNMDIVKP